MTPLNSINRLLCLIGAVYCAVRAESLYLLDACLASERRHMFPVQTVIKRYIKMVHLNSSLRGR